MVKKNFQPLEESYVISLHLVFEFLLVAKRKYIYVGIWYWDFMADVCFGQKVRAVDTVQMVQ